MWRLQEAQPPPTELGIEAVPGSPDWWTGGARRDFCTAVARLSDRVGVRYLATRPLNERGGPDLPVSLTGSIALAELSVPGHQPVTVASVYCAWESVPQDGSGWIVSDAAAHRVLSDLSGLIETQRGHRLIVAGDWNLYRGYGDRGSTYWRDRYQTVFDRAAALGLVFCGPQHPNGSQADPWPEYLPTDSGNVPTYRRNVADPATAVDQLDFVFASEAIADLVTATALNVDWGPSDHCRVRIELDLERQPVADAIAPAKAAFGTPRSEFKSEVGLPHLLLGPDYAVGVEREEIIG